MLGLRDDEIGRRLAESAASGELASAARYGKPLDLGDGFDATPAALRMGFKILKDAGFVPPEVQLLKDLAALRDALARAGDGVARAELQRRVHDAELSLAFAMARLTGGSAR